MSKHNLGEVRIALQGVGDPEAAMQIVRNVAGVSKASKIPEEKFDAVIRAANARAARGDVRPGINASRDVNSEAQEFWDSKRAAQKSGEAMPELPADPGGHNASELQKLSREADEFRDFVGGTKGDV